MQPRSKPEASRLNLFQAQLKQILNLDHPLCVLAQKIDWSRLVGGVAECDCPDFGAPAKGIQLMVGMHYLKHAFNESDESLVQRQVENPYWQFFYGFETVQHEPLHSEKPRRRRDQRHPCRSRLQYPKASAAVVASAKSVALTHPQKPASSTPAPAPAEHGGYRYD